MSVFDKNNFIFIFIFIKPNLQRFAHLELGQTLYLNES